MESVIFVLALVLISYVGAEWLFRMRKLPFVVSSLFHSGMGFVIIGIIIGPHGFGWLDTARVDLLVSIESLALSLIGIVFGLQFRLRSMRLIAYANYRVAVVQSVIVFVLAFLLILPIRWIFPEEFLSVREALPFIFALAAIASVTSPTAAAAVVRRMNAHGTAARLLRYVTATDAFVGVSIFGLTLSFFRLDGMAEGALIDGLMWFGLTLGVGALLGFIYHVFLAMRLSSNERLVVASGTVVLTAGVASLLSISPLFLSMIAGVVLTNFSETQDRLFRLLASAKKPIFGLMLILLGAKWVGFHPMILILGFAYVAIRIFSKIIGSRFALRMSGIGMPGSISFGFSLTGQGGMTVAMALDFMSRYDAWSSQVLISIIIVSFFANALLSPYMIRRMLLAEEGAE